MRTTIVVASVALCCLTLAGCQGKRSPSSSAVGNPAPRTIMLSVLAGQSTSDAGTGQMINDLLRRRLPGVRLEWERVDWGEQFEAQMHAEFASGEVPDIMIGKAQDVKTYVPTGNLARVPASLAKLIDVDALPGVTVNGRVYGLPYDAFYQGVFYNKGIFRREGFSIPKTPDALSNLIRKLKRDRITPFAAHFEEDWFVGNIFMQFATGNIFNRTPNWGDEFRAHSVSFARSPAVRRDFGYVKEILDNSWPDALTIGQTQADERFAKGQAAMYVTGTWSLQTINAVNPHMNVGVFPFPNRAGDAKLIFEPNMTFMSSSKTAHPKVVENVLRTIFESTGLASEIFDYTKTSSLLRGIHPAVPLLIQPAIDRYRTANRVTDVTLGNTQLIWSFQAAVAKQAQKWLRGTISLQSVLNFADENRALSAP